MFDVDFFKKINDSFGHLAGDEVLRDIGRRVPTCIRDEDFFARIGGEEFVVVTRSEKIDDVGILADRLRIAMEKEPSSFEGRGIVFTISVGYTFVNPKNETPLEKILGTADEALYAAKHGGRNKTVVKTLP
jgi:diguanylate cyclase (GGDEF)-like protein